jgi:hypothetical protein
MNKKENNELKEPAWKTKMRKVFAKYPDYQEFRKHYQSWTLEEWKFAGELIRAEGPHFKKVGNKFIQI